MSWTAEWQDENEYVITISVSSEQWEWEDFKRIVVQIFDMVRSKPYTVDLIIHIAPGFSLPRSASRERMSPWEPLRDMVTVAPPNRGLTLIIDAPLVLRSMMQNLKTTTKDSLATDHIKFVETMEQTQQIIEEARAERDEET